MAERDLTIDDFDCASMSYSSRNVPNHFQRLGLGQLRCLQLVMLVFHLLFFSVVVFMGARIMSLDILMGIISTWTSSPCSDAFPQFFRRSSTKPWTPTAWPYSISVFLALIFWDIWMRLIGKQQFDISTPFSRHLMSTVAFMVILRPGNKEQKRQKQRDCFCLFCGF